MGPDPALNPELIQAQSFTSSFRGYDASEVRSFLGRVATEVRSLRERIEQLESAWHSAEERAARPPVIDEDMIMSAVGEETASILRTARAAAVDMRSKAAEEAEQTVAAAAAESVRIGEEARAQHEQESRSARESAERMVASAESEATQILGKARSEAEVIRAQAQQDRALTVEGANATRDRILDDLVRRRNVAEVQIEQLRAGRERLMESYGVVRRTLEEVQSELSRADAEARAAADEVGRRLRGHDAPLPPARPSSPPSGGAGVILDDLPVPLQDPVDPGPLDADPVDPGPLDADPVDPGPIDPGPVDLGAVDPGPVDLGAVDPGAVDAEPPPEQVADAGDGAGSAVDELFARIRSTGRTKKPAKASKKTGAANGTATMTREAPQSAVATDVVEPETELEAAEPSASQSSPEEPTDPDERLLQTRERLVSELEAGLTRKLKRTLQDEQNDLLDRLRLLKSEPSAGQLLPALDDHLAIYENAATPLLVEAAAAGGGFASELTGQPCATEPADEVDDLASEAATSIVEPLRRRLEQAIVSSSGDDQTALVESLGAAYREWKSQRIERISGDVLHAAFARGTWRATPAGASVRWIVDDVDGPCPDCDDDALAGTIPKGEQFPTGQNHPPAHSGCRCLLVPSPA